MTIEELKVIISAETKELKSALKEVQSSVKSLTGYVRKQTSSIGSSINSSIKKISSSFKSLGSIITKALSAAALLALGKSAIDLASDIEEVQNVVNVAFGEMAAQAEFFAQRCASAFGLSELMAKRTSSTYMAMATAMNLSNEAAKTMSLQLTALSGDMASFFNVQQSVADTALKSVFTGETETLKKFGIVMTEANLEAYRLAQGIKKSYSEMSQAEKVALRYNYVMQNTSLAQGDFVRTSSSWANQIRILKMRWEELMASMGVILTHVLIPIIQALNVILSQIVSIAKGFAAMFAPKAETEQITSMGAGFSSVTENIEDATDAAKKYKRTVAGFDELNLLKDPNTDSGAGAAGGAGLNMEIAEPYDFNALAGTTDEAKISLQEIINSFNDFIANLNSKMEEYRAVVDGWGAGLASGINSIVDGIDWSSIGQSIGNGLNLAIGFIKNFREELDTYDIGKAIADLINNSIATLDWTGLTDAIIAKLNGIIQGIKGFIVNLDAAELTQQLNTLFQRIATEVDWVGLGTVLGGGINMALTSVFALITGVDFQLFATNVFEGFKAAIDMVDWGTLGETISELIKQLFAALDESGLGESIGNAIRELFDGIDWWGIFAEVTEAKGDIIGSAIAGFFGVDNPTLVEGLQNIAAGIVGVKGAFDLLSPVITFIIGLIETILTFNTVGRIKEIKNVVNELKNDTSVSGEVINSTWDTIKTKISDVATTVKDKVVTAFTTMKEKTISLCTTIKDKIIDAFTKMKTSVSDLATKIKDSVIEAFTKMKGKAIELATKIKDGAIDAFTKMKTKSLDVLGKLKDGAIGAFEGIKAGFSKVVSFIMANPMVLIIAAIVALVVLIATKGDEIQAVLNKVTKFLTGIFTKDWTEVFGPVLGSILNGFSKAFGDIWNGIQEILNGVIDVIRGVFTGDWERAWEGVKGIFKGIWDSLVGIVKAPINLIIGFINGMLAGIEKAVNKIVGVVNKLSFDVPDWVPVIGGKTFGFNLKTITVSKIPQLADGGVVYESTIANVGEYAGAKHNPEIVTPQSLMQETMETAMLPMINAYVAMGNRILKAIEDKDLDVYMDTTKVTRKITKEQNNQAKYKSTSLVLV